MVHLLRCTSMETVGMEKRAGGSKKKGVYVMAPSAKTNSTSLSMTKQLAKPGLTELRIYQNTCHFSDHATNFSERDTPV